MLFVAIDFETANADLSSICQLGVAKCVDGVIEETWKTYIDPKDEFAPINISIHGITEEMVKGSPSIVDVAGKLSSFLKAQTVLSHTSFDRVALHQCYEKNMIPIPDCTWLDTARVARRAWEEFAWNGYGLQNICHYIGYRFTHHDALEDAKAAAQIMLAAIKKTGIGIDEWVKRVRCPIGTVEGHTGIARPGNPDGPFHGEVIVFTGALSVRRSQAADTASHLGFEVAEGVNKRTTMLVVGDQDIRMLAGHEKSTKHRKAEMLISEGQDIRLLRESDFFRMATLLKENT